MTAATKAAETAPRRRKASGDAAAAPKAAAKDEVPVATVEELGRRVESTLTKVERPWNQYVKHRSKQNPPTGGVIHAKAMSLEWKNLPEVEKEVFRQTYLNSRAARENAIKNLTTSDRKHWRAYIKALRLKRRARSAEKKKTGYMQFNLLRHKQIREQNAKMPFGDVSKKVAQEWREMTPEQRQAFSA